MARYSKTLASYSSFTKCNTNNISEETDLDVRDIKLCDPTHADTLYFATTVTQLKSLNCTNAEYKCRLFLF